jgi:hypothetical protein
VSDKRIPLPGESTPADVLSVLEVMGPHGGVRFRISRYCSADGGRWVRHGPFLMLHPNGAVATRGGYRDGLEEGEWHYYYEGGQLAAEGCYCAGKEVGYWRYWRRDGSEQLPVEYVRGEVVGPSER